MKQIGAKIVRLNSVDSTNNYAANLLKSGNWQSGTVILADEQTGGRGQRGNSWYSEAGMNLTTSILLKQDNLSVNDAFDVSKYVAVSIIKLLANYGIKGEIKWPNDILVNEKKIAGILIENQLQQSRIESSIIGIGLNVNQLEFQDLNATSIRSHSGNFIPIFDLLMSMIQSFNSMLNQSKEEIDKAYINLLWGYQKEVCYAILETERPAKGTIIGVDSQGFLMIKESGELKKYDLKEVQFKLQSKT